MSGHVLRVITPHADTAATRTLANALSPSFLVSFDFRLGGAAIRDNDFLGLWFGSTFGRSIGLKCNCGTIGFRTAFLDDSPRDSLLVDNLRIAVVPTPGTLALLGLGLVAAGLASRRRR